jgi:hypothetical protein
MKSMTLRLDRFGQDALEEYVRGTRGSHAAAVHAAVRYYLGDAGSGRVAWRVPRLAREAEPARALELELDEPFHGAAPGQAACLLHGDVIVGWATISAQ